MDRIRMELDGLDKLVRQLKSISRSMAGAAIEAALAGGQVVADRANQNLGRSGSVVVEFNGSETSAARAVVDIGLREDRWFYRFLEYGTSPHEIAPRYAAALRFHDNEESFFSAGHMVSGIAAEPFLRPAIDTSGRAVVDAMAQVYNNRIRRAM